MIAKYTYEIVIRLTDQDSFYDTETLARAIQYGKDKLQYVGAFVTIKQGTVNRELRVHSTKLIHTELVESEH